MPGAPAILLQLCASLISPGTGRSIAKVEQPLLSRRSAFAALFMGQRQVEMDVGMCRHRSRCAAQMFHGFVHFACFFEGAAKIVAGDSVQRIEFHCGAKCITGVRDLPGLVVSDAQVDVRFDPIGRQVDDALVDLNRFGNCVGARFVFQRHFEKLFGGSTRHGAQFRRHFRWFKRKRPLPPDRIERHRRTRRYDQHFTAVLLNAMLLERTGRRSELLLGKRNGETNATSRNSTFGEPFDRAESDKIAEAVEPFTPASARVNEL